MIYSKIAVTGFPRAFFTIFISLLLFVGDKTRIKKADLILKNRRVKIIGLCGLIHDKGLDRKSADCSLGRISGIFRSIL